jgi:hypothetical protein
MEEVETQLLSVTQEEALKIPTQVERFGGHSKKNVRAAIHAAMSRDHAPLESLFSCALDGPWRPASSST